MEKIPIHETEQDYEGISWTNAIAITVLVVIIIAAFCVLITAAVITSNAK